MFRKLDSVRKCSLAAPSGWTQKEMTVTPIVSEDGVRQEVSFLDVPCSTISDRQLNPEDVKLETIIMTGAIIDPGNFRKILNNTDPAEIEQHRDKFDSDFLEYINDNKDQLLKSE